VGKTGINVQEEFGMAVIRVSDAYGQGIVITAGPLLGNPDEEGTLISSTWLGGTRYLESYSTPPGYPFDSFTGVINVGPASPVIEALNYFSGDTLVLEIFDARITSAALALGASSFLGGSDRIIGNQFTDFLRGFDGNDFINCREGDDRAYGGSGNDRIFGELGSDTLYGNPGSDTLDGGGGRDVLEGNSGPDRLFGGGGQDRLLGGSGHDILVGGSKNDRLVGDRGQDTLIGNKGADVLIGGRSADLLIGGFGADQFIYTSERDSLPRTSHRDSIDGFDHGRDVINLSTIDANPFRRGDQVFDFLGDSAFSGAGPTSAGELRFFTFGGQQANIVEADLDGDGKADMQILIGKTDFMTEADFIL
jgi:Ca2+-binding RTX toxin-like protein